MKTLHTLLGASLLFAASATIADAKPLKVFILAGQSNMDGQAHIRTIDFLGEDKDPARAALLKTFKPDGTNLVTRDDVWVANAGVYDKLDDQLLTKEVADKWNEGRVEPVVGLQYRNMVRSVHKTLKNLKTNFPGYDEKAGYEIAGFVWFQGFNDLFDETGRKQYGANLVHLINDVRKEFKTPEMPVVVGVMGVNGPHNEHNPKQKDIRDGQRFINTVPEFKGNAKAIETAPLLDPRVVALTAGGWLPEYDRDFKKSPITEEERAMLSRAMSNKGFHYSGEGRFFILVGKAFAETMQELMGVKK